MKNRYIKNLKKLKNKPESIKKIQISIYFNLYEYVFTADKLRMLRRPAIISSNCKYIFIPETIARSGKIITDSWFSTRLMFKITEQAYASLILYEPTIFTALVSKVPDTIYVNRGKHGNTPEQLLETLKMIEHFNK